ncbi:2'-deoxynucleoside 5'-phosphate N-hydrolase 1 isoform X1 [Phycodurus eques]|uniref:2'-deoxynucleoside 5'-phosphate N-hydrolase 1 isoform X1 n=1 Tax=Phycodurus eques TaxID=693459 RepID=UPI002ACED10D|nr:2'-deoxynucleoside 5'-phosphate N-hydrolase 1 isoform X1 [Phycodurus eques]
MKIYFCGSIRGGRDDACVYEHVVKTLGKFGKVLTEHVGDSELTDTGEESQDVAIHDRDMEWLRQADGEPLLICPYAIINQIDVNGSRDSRRCRGDAAVTGRGLRTRPCLPDEEEDVVSLSTISWTHVVGHDPRSGGWGADVGDGLQRRGRCGQHPG